MCQRFIIFYGQYIEKQNKTKQNKTKQQNKKQQQQKKQKKNNKKKQQQQFIYELWAHTISHH